MLKQGIIEHSDSPYNFPIFLIPKKPDSSGKIEYRFRTDLRKLNKEILDQDFPIPRISEIIDFLKDSKYFSSLDMYSGFTQMLLDPADREKIAFSTHNGHFNYTRTCFGV